MTALEEDVVGVLRHIVETQVDYRGGPITPEADLAADLELDSVSRTIVLVGLEQHYDITLDLDALSTAKTVADLVRVVIAARGTST